ncbi:DUF4159 domain-containing protein [Candidatus Latescibacterota bacterium]
MSDRYVNKHLSKFSTIIDIEKLERESLKFLYLGFIISVFLHIGLAAYIALKKPLRDKNIQNVSVNLLVHRPELNRPFNVSEKNERERYAYRKKTVSGQPSREIATKNVSKLEIPDQTYRWDIDQTIAGSFDILADSLLANKLISLQPQDIIPLKNSLFIDTGVNKSTIIMNPENKMAIQGYTHIVIGRGKTLIPPDYLPTAVHNLAHELNRFTNIYATSDRCISLHYPPGTEVIINKQPASEWTYKMRNKSPDEMFNYPFIYIYSDKSFELTEEEKQNLGKYLRSGGFVIVENGEHDNRFGHAGKSLKQMMIDAIGTVKLFCGDPPKILTVNDYSFKILPKDHPIFHCFFDFNNGIPSGSYFDNSNSYIEGIYMGSRLVGIYSSHGYGQTWQNLKNKEQLKLGVNMIVYAISRQKGFYISDCRKGRSVWKYANTGSIRAW